MKSLQRRKPDFKIVCPTFSSAREVKQWQISNVDIAQTIVKSGFWRCNDFNVGDFLNSVCLTLLFALVEPPYYLTEPYPYFVYLQNSTPEPEAGCDEESIENAKSLWQQALQNNDKTQTHTIDMTSLASFGMKFE